MSDTYSTNLKVRLPQTGAYEETWGDILNADTIELLDDAISGWSVIPLTTTSYSLAALSDGLASESRASVLNFTGAPGGAATVTVPASVTRKMYMVKNDTNQTVNVKYATGATAVVATLTAKFVLCTGADCYVVPY